MKKGLRSRIRDILATVRYRLFVLRYHFKIIKSEKTIDVILSKKLSVARFGDGEFKWILGIKQNSFQDQDSLLSVRLAEIINTNSPRCLICIPEILVNDNGYTTRTKKFWHNFVRWHGKEVVKFLSDKKMYGDTNFTRWYRSKKMKDSEYKNVIRLLKKIWDKRDVLIVEGELTRFGVGNDLLDNANNVKRIIAPSKNAFSYYDEILRIAKEHGRNKLVLVALGPTATVLAYDLSEFGIQAIDIGHLDIEYEWYLRGAHEQKIKIPGKYVNEAGGIDEEMNDKKALRKYSEQIVARVGVQK